MVASKGPAHVLLVPPDSRIPSHFPTFLQFLYHFTDDRYNNVVVTVAGSKPQGAELTALRDRGDFRGVDLRFQEVFQHPRVELRTTSSISDSWELDFEPYKRTLLKNRNDADAPTSIVSDMFMPWMQDIAEELGVPWYPVYATASWYPLSCLVGSKLQKQGLLHPNSPEKRYDAVPWPGLTFTRALDFPPDVLEFPEFHKLHVQRMARAAAVLINTAEELDAPTAALKSIRTELESLAAKENRLAPRVLSIGPMVQIPGFSSVPSTKLVLPSDLETERTKCLQWLDKQPASSVLYIAFGTLVDLTFDSAVELAHALETVEIPFLWVLKLPPTASLSSVLPPGFEARTKERGLITGWAPQKEVLLHPSTCGFMSHCGWNSSLEAISAGVPVVACPLFNDEPMVAQFLVDVLKMGLAIKTTDEDYSKMRREELAITLRALIPGEERGQLAKRYALKAKKLVELEVAEGGSSYRNLHAFLHEITRPFESPIEV